MRPVIRLHRRTFVELGVLTGASIIVLPACSKEFSAPRSDLTLEADERALIERFAEVYLPTEGTSLKPRSEVPIVENIEHALRLMDEPTLKQVRLGLKLFDYGSILIGLHLARFTSLSLEQRLEYIRRWEDGVAPQRGIVGVLKKLICLGYWQDIEAGQAIGYRGPVSEAAGLVSLGNAPMPSGAS